MFGVGQHSHLTFDIPNFSLNQSWAPDTAGLLITKKNCYCSFGMLKPFCSGVQPWCSKDPGGWLQTSLHGGIKSSTLLQDSHRGRGLNTQDTCPLASTQSCDCVLTTLSSVLASLSSSLTSQSYGQSGQSSLCALDVPVFCNKCLSPFSYTHQE